MFSNLRSAIGRAQRIRQRANRRDSLCYGSDFIADVKNRLPPVRTIFDVGAWQGVMALEFADAFPDATIYAFEPVRGNFANARRNLAVKGDKAKVFNIALGATPGQGYISVEPVHTSTGKLLNGPNNSSQPTEINTIDRFCAAHKLSAIDIVKIDVEGFEQDVIAGAKAMLSEGTVGLVRLECTADPDQAYHTSFFALCEFLHPFGYRLFGVYDQYECWENPSAKLRRFDAAFVSERYASR